MKRTRDFRRKQFYKYVDKTFRILKYCWRMDDSLSRKEIKEKARHMAGNRKPCSCEGCMNPRHSSWCNNTEKLTIQERKSLQDDLAA